MKTTITPNAISVTLTCDNDADALRLWAILSLSGEDVRRIIEKLAAPEVHAKYATDLPESLYPIWNELDDLLAARGIL